MTEDAAEAMQRMMDRLIELEQELLKHRTANTAVQSQFILLASGRGSKAARIASGHETWKARRVRRNGVKVARLESRHELIRRSVLRGTCRVDDEAR